MKNYYQILEVAEGASQEEIKQAYRKLAKQNHPDVNKSPDAHQNFCEISEAYEFLMNYWPQYASKYSGTNGVDQKYREHQKSEAYEQFMQEAQARARKQARMRYEKFRKQHEAFQESGLNDLALIFTMFMRIFSIILLLFLFFAPLVLAFAAHWTWIFAIFFMWPFAAGIAWYYHDNRKNYFKPWNFYYSAARISSMFRETHEANVSCFYCKNKMANSRSYRLDLLKLKDVKIATGGFRQHNVNYINKELAVMIPRSQKAFIIQSIIIFIKIFSIAACLVFLNISSLAWRLIIGIIAGGILSGLLLFLSGTRSNVSYIFNYSQVIRIIIWISAVSLATKFYLDPLDAVSNEGIYFAVFAVVIFDSFLMQFISIVLGKYSSYPILRQYPEVESKIKEGYILYNDIPVLSFFYPIIKWIFG
jgi:hypothetical protein